MDYTPNPNRATRGGKAVVSAKELASFREKYGAEKDLTDLLNMDKGLQRQIPRSTMKATRARIDSEQGASRARDSNAPIRGAKLSANESDPNTISKVDNIRRTFNMPEPLDSVPGQEYKKGGMTASKRADGIAQRGRTRGKMY